MIYGRVVDGCSHKALKIEIKKIPVFIFAFRGREEFAVVVK